MSWRDAISFFFYSPILVGILFVCAIFLIWKLPMVCCERCRVVRYLPFAGLAYYGFVVPLILIAMGWGWWIVIGTTVFLALASDWLLPDPFTFFFNPRDRRAVKLAIEHVEASRGPRPNYSTAGVIGLEHGRTIVAVDIQSYIRPPPRRFLAVANDSNTIEELDFDYVSTKHNVKPRW